MDTIEETEMSLLAHPQARVLLADAEVTVVQGQGGRWWREKFSERFVPLF